MRTILLVIAVMVLPCVSWAQQAPVPVIVGTISTTGCQPGVASCFVPGGGTGGGSGGTVTQGAAGTAPWLIGLPANTALPVTATNPLANDALTVNAAPGITVATTSTTVVPASTGTRGRASIWNTSGNTAWCRSDGGAATLNVGMQIPAGGGYEWVYPLVGPAAITCIMATAAGVMTYEAFQ
jgi:hypothetical protein